MTTIIKRMAVMLFAALVLATPAVSAAPLFNTGGYCQGEAASSSVCQDAKGPKNTITGSNGIIIKVANLLAVIAGAAAVIMIIINGLKMVTSNGNSEGFASARRGILYALVGLVVIALSRAIVGLVLTRL